LKKYIGYVQKKNMKTKNREELLFLPPGPNTKVLIKAQVTADYIYI